MNLLDVILNRRWRAARALAAAILGAACMTASAADGTEAVTYLIGPKAEVQKLYPDQSWLPQAYKKLYPHLATTIEHYTRRSLHQDGVKNAKVRVSVVRHHGVDQMRVRITPANDVTRRYAQVHPQFLDKDHAQAALKAVQACMQSDASPKCWDRKPVAGEPWAFYLPLGMAMVNTKAVMFMNYPPTTSLTDRDYLDNYTICRWNQVLSGVAVSDAKLTDVIIDSRPIAAPGSHTSQLLPDATTLFKDGAYLTPMLRLLTRRADAANATTKPVVVFGEPARETWGKIIGRKNLEVLDASHTVLDGQSKRTSWIIANHPIKTSYNCCAGDTTCQADDRDLIKNEQLDFIAACWLHLMSSAKPPSEQQAKEQCEADWRAAPSASNKQTVCMQAKLDNQNKHAVCATREKAWNYCVAHDANACASLTCNDDETKATLAPPPRLTSFPDCSRYPH